MTHGSVVVIFHDIVVVEINELRKEREPVLQGEWNEAVRMHPDPFSAGLDNFTSKKYSCTANMLHAKRIAHSLP